jgi:hypothetical protein
MFITHKAAYGFKTKCTVKLCAIHTALWVLSHIDPLLGNDHETNYETTTVARYRCVPNNGINVAAVLSMWSAPRLYHSTDRVQFSEAWRRFRIPPTYPRESLEATKRVPSAWGYNRATLFLGDINTETWPSRLGQSRIWVSKIWSRIPWDSDPRMIVLARTSSNCKRQTCSLVRESAPHQQTCTCLTNKNLVVSPRWMLVTKTDRLTDWLTDWLTDRRSIVLTLTVQSRTLDERPSVFIREPIFSSERMLHKDYYHKSSVEKICGRGSQGAWRQDELIGGKPPVVKLLWLWQSS